jgi:hypothetical protein
VVSVTDPYVRILGFLDRLDLYSVIELKKSGAETNCRLSLLKVVQKQNDIALHMLLLITGVAYSEIRLLVRVKIPMNSNQMKYIFVSILMQ